MATTPNRNYPLPVASNPVRDDVARLIAAFEAIDGDVAGLLAAVATKAAIGHGHSLADIAGLVDALNGKAGINHTHAFASLSDVSIAGAPAGRPLTIQPGGTVGVGPDWAATIASINTAVAVRVPQSRAISAGTGLTGGGDLTANRSISAQTHDQAAWESGESSTEAVISPAKLKGAVASLAPLDGVTSAVASNTGRISALETGKAFTRPPYESPEQIITSGGQLTLGHGLGVLPKLLVAEIVCLTAEHGWAVGQRVPVPLGGEYISGNGANLNATAGATDTAIMVQYGSGGTGGNVFLIHNASGISQYATNANWRLVLRAFA